jgi:hypothetical protein
MAASRKSIRVCPNGHRYEKSSDCPVCPICERERAPSADFHSPLAAPARRALEGAGLTTLAKLARWREADLLALHGIGPSALPKLRSALSKAGLRFREPEEAMAEKSAARPASKSPANRKLNAAWHKAHPMPRNATPPERGAWHLAHAKACGCREMPPSVLAWLERRKL